MHEEVFKTTFTSRSESTFNTGFSSRRSTVFNTTFSQNQITSHNTLYGRDSPNQHPIEAITGLREELDDLASRVTSSMEVKTRGELPNRGKSSVIYIVADENASYRWDEDNNKYFCIGRDYEEIKIIICGGNANGD